MTRDDLLHALQIDNVVAWLRVIRQGESNQNEDAFTIRFGGAGRPAAHFVGFDDHPRIFEPTEDGKRSSASGAYQITATTWDDYCGHLGKQPFTPENQALCAVWLTARAKALDDVIAGRLDAAIRKCPLVWTSLGLAHRKAQAPEIFRAYGGVIAGEGTTIHTTEATAREAPVIPQPAARKEVKSMGVFAALLPSILQALPQLIGIFGSPDDSEVAKRNQQAGVIVADTLVKATNAVNLQDAVDKLQSDPTALAAAHDAMNDLIPRLVEAGGGGLDGARKANADPTQQPPWKDKTFLMACMFYPLIAFVIVASMLDVSWLAEITPETRAGVIMFVLGTICGGFMTYFTGTSVGSQRKDSIIAGQK